MKCFLTSSVVIPNTDYLNPENGLLDKLREYIPNPCAGLFICSDPCNHELTDRFSASVKAGFETAGFRFSRFDVLDNRNSGQAAALVKDVQFLILAGGHVPTQNRFFQEISLKHLLRSFDGVLLGISAGSMNCADVVYAQPELEGEAISTSYQRFLPGLGVTKAMILPHYQAVKDEILDGLHMMEDITYPDSFGQTFYALVDGSYIFISCGVEQICGEAYRIADGQISQISANGQHITLDVH